MTYGIIFWGNSPYSIEIFKIQKKKKMMMMMMMMMINNNTNNLVYMDDIKLYAATINYKNFYGSLTLFQETLKWYLGLKSAKHYLLQRGN